MTNSKKRKIILGTCIPVATLGVAGAVTGIVLAMQKTSDSFDKNTQIKLTFNAGEGAEFEANSTTTQIVDKTSASLKNTKAPAVKKAGAIFAGWKLNDAPVRDDVLFKTLANPDSCLTLTASYVDEATPGINHIVTFNKGTADILTGNTSVAVASGKEFLTVNRPQAEKANCIFTGWKYVTPAEKAGQTVQELDIIEANWTLQPIFTETKQVTFSNSGKLVDEEKGTTSDVGIDYVGSTNPYYNLEDATGLDIKWENVNKPEATARDHAEAYLEGYYTDAACTSKITNTTTIKSLTDPATVYLKFTTAPTESYSILNFTKKAVKEDKSTAIDVVYSGNETQAVLFATEWQNMNKPIASVSGSTEYEVVSWQWIEAANESVTTGWADITDTTKFKKIETVGNHYYIRPVMKPKAAGVIISGETSAVVGQNTLKYKAWVKGTTTDTTEWKLYYNNGTTSAPDWKEDTEKTYGELSATTGVAQDTDVTLTVKDRSFVDGKKDLKIEITSTADTLKKSDIEISVNFPYVDSDKVWFHDDTENIWFNVPLAELCDTSLTESLTLKDVNGQSGPQLLRTDFNKAITLGDKITEVPDNFLAGCTSMNSSIKLNKATVIKDNFMEGCTAFNGIIGGLEEVTKIGNSFMAYCDAYVGNTVGFDHLLEVGDDFMFHCDKFNEEFVMPIVKSIGDSFLENCKAFNKNIIFPSALTSVGDFCMRGCEAFTAQITANTNAFVANDYSFSAATATAIQTTGFTVTGSFTDEFIAKFGNKSDHGIYRKVTGVVTNLEITGESTVPAGGSIEVAANWDGPKTGITIVWSFQGGTAPTGWSIQQLASPDLNKATVALDSGVSYAQSATIVVTVSGTGIETKTASFDLTA